MQTRETTDKFFLRIIKEKEFLKFSICLCNKINFYNFQKE